MLRGMFLLVALLSPSFAVGAAPGQSELVKTYEIRRHSENAEQTDGTFSSSSSDTDTLTERVVSVQATGIELEYDLPKVTTKEDRARSWQFPVRIFKPLHGSAQLLNRQELESRIGKWLERAKLPRAACGHWYFTWNAFRVDCDPDSVLATLNAFDLRPSDLRNGAMYHDAMAREPAVLKRQSATTGGTKLGVELVVDPDVVRRGEAEADVVTGEILQKPVTLDAALRAHATEVISGSIAITFDSDTAGLVWQQTKVLHLETKDPDGKLRVRNVTETLDRRLLSQ